MEERVVGGKDKKYVLYTVVGEEKNRAGVGVWVVRVLLATLLLVALGVVPYVSLKLAQVNDARVLVFEEIQPRSNHSGSHHHKKYANHLAGPLQSASLTKDNTTTTKAPTTVSKSSSTSEGTSTSSSPKSSSIVTVHEAAVTLSIIEDSNVTKVSNIPVETSESVNSNKDATTTLPTLVEENVTATTIVTKKSEIESTTTAKPNNIVTDQALNTTASSTSEIQTTTPIVTVPSTTKNTNKSEEVTVTSTVLPQKENQTAATEKTPLPSKTTDLTTTIPVTQKKTNPPNKTENLKSTSKIVSTIISTIPTTSKSVTSTASTISSSHKPLAHKLAYVATSSSGNHVGGFAVWRTDNKITDWSYFYENIPIEYQSREDNTDHEMRALLAAIRAWSHKWQDYHVILRSQHSSIEGSKHPTKMQLDDEIEARSEGHFTYEMEWRTRKGDELVHISYGLARLYRNFKHWFRQFKKDADTLLGPQDWDKATKEHRVIMTEENFATDPVEDDDDVSSDTFENEQDQSFIRMVKGNTLNLY